MVDLEEIGANGPYFRPFCGSTEVDLFRRQLLTWYASSRRRLPWRGDPEPWSESKAKKQRKEVKLVKAESRSADVFPTLRATGDDDRERLVIDVEDEKDEFATKFTPCAYGVWVSEVMLQQTQVEVVIPYWTRWMKRFPTLECLAAASEEEVNSYWAGLGFYGRARRLHQGAQYVMSEHHGSIPSSIEALRRIPGIGPYTAGAIASIALGKVEALVDGNVARVFSRLCAIALPAKSPALLKLSWKLAKGLVDPTDPGSFNQALMELGATVCTPSSPSCDQCPLRSKCRAYELCQKGLLENVMNFPTKAVQKERKERYLAIAAVQDGDTWMLIRRPPRGLLANQLDFPSIDITGDLEDPMVLNDVISAEILQKLQRKMLEDFDLSVKLQSLERPLEHLFSHERHVMHLFVGQTTAPNSHSKDGTKREVMWMSMTEAEDMGITSGVQKVFAALTGCKRRKRGAALEQRMNAGISEGKKNGEVVARTMAPQGWALPDYTVTTCSSRGWLLAHLPS